MRRRHNRLESPRPAKVRPAYPSTGQLLTNISGTSVEGSSFSLSDFKGSRNLVLALAPVEGEHLLESLSRSYDAIRNEETDLIVVLRCPLEQARQLMRGRAWPYIVLADPDGEVHRRLGAVDRQGNPAPAIYVTDCWGEVFLACRTAEGDAWPTTEEIVKSLKFIEIQCPECYPPEWPA